jgi:hypothetical protein
VIFDVRTALEERRGGEKRLEESWKRKKKHRKRQRQTDRPTDRARRTSEKIWSVGREAGTNQQVTNISVRRGIVPRRRLLTHQSVVFNVHVTCVCVPECGDSFCF